MPIPRSARRISAQQPDAVAATKAIIGFSPSVINQKVGKTFNVDVVVKDARNLSSVPVQILYDPQKLQFITVTSGGLLDRDGQTAALVQRVNSSAGRINVSISRPSYCARNLRRRSCFYSLRLRAKLQDSLDCALSRLACATHRQRQYPSIALRRLSTSQTQQLPPQIPRITDATETPFPSLCAHCVVSEHPG